MKDCPLDSFDREEPRSSYLKVDSSRRRVDLERGSVRALSERRGLVFSLQKQLMQALFARLVERELASETNAEDPYSEHVFDMNLVSSYTDVSHGGVSDDKHLFESFRECCCDSSFEGNQPVYMPIFNAAPKNRINLVIAMMGYANIDEIIRAFGWGRDDLTEVKSSLS